MTEDENDLLHKSVVGKDFLANTIRPDIDAMLDYRYRMGEYLKKSKSRESSLIDPRLLSSNEEMCLSYYPSEWIELEISAIDIILKELTT